MDRVRLGRVLGRGARMAAQTAYQALDAAAAPAPQQRQPVVQRPAAAPTVLRPVAQNSPPKQRGAAPQVGHRRPMAIFAPFRRATHAVSLEVTGSFFALFTLSFAVGAWHERDQVHAGSQGLMRLALFCAVTGFFAYCSISSFVRARRLR